MSLNLTVRRTLCVMIALTLFLSDKVIGDDKPTRAYFVGNSVTDTIRYGSLAKLAQSRGHTLTWGRDMIPGAPLQWLWEHPKDGFQEEPFGLYPRALSEYSWDVLSLQPFDRHLDGKDGDLAMAGNFIDLALKRSPDLQVYVYSRWPRRDKAKDGSLALDYKTKWLRKYTGGWDGTEETRDYFEKLVAGLREVLPEESQARAPGSRGRRAPGTGRADEGGQGAGLQRHRPGLRGRHPLQQRRLLRRRHDFLRHAVPGRPEGPDRRALQREARPGEGPPDRREAGGCDPGCGLDRGQQAPTGRSSQGFISGGAVRSTLTNRWDRGFGITGSGSN